MICYINELALQQELSQIPVALREKHIYQIEQGWKEWGIRTVDNRPGVIQVDITKSTQGNVLRWLEGNAIAAVDLEGSDIRVLLGGAKTMTAAVVIDALNISSAVRAELSRLTPDEIMPALEKVVFQVAFAKGEITTEQAEAKATALRSEGFDIPTDRYSELEPVATKEPSTEWDEEFGIGESKTDIFDQNESELPSLGGYFGE